MDADIACSGRRALSRKLLACGLNRNSLQRQSRTGTVRRTGHTCWLWVRRQGSREPRTVVWRRRCQSSEARVLLLHVQMATTPSATGDRAVGHSGELIKTRSIEISSNAEDYSKWNAQLSVEEEKCSTSNELPADSPALFGI